MTTHFNLKTFSKILALAESTPIQDHPAMERERGAALNRAKAMAEAAGMTLEAAVCLARGELPEQPQPRSEPKPSSSGFWGDMFKEQDEKRAAAARHPWPEHPMERRLREALVGHRIKGTWLFSDAEPETLTAIRDAIPFPTDMLGAIAEETAWNDLETERDGVMPEYRLSDGPLTRRSMLREYLDGPARTPQEKIARARWLVGRRKREMASEREVEGWLATMAADMANLIPDTETDAPQRPVRVTNAEKRMRVRLLLSEPGAEELSMREIARRAGVSVQIVINMKREMEPAAVI